MAKAIMIQGTMSGVGKSLLAAGLCRIFRQDGYRTAPFKSQNMALNSFVTEDGLEMGRAQVMQAEAAGASPDVRMNPVLLKPTTDTGSQVIVLGEVLADMDARKYFAYKKKLMPTVLEAYSSLAKEYDILVIEGAGSPAEINLKSDDIVNMGLAKAVGAPVLLAGDIDRGGVFAQLLGTQMLLDPDEQALLKGFIINKFRGDKTILDPGVRMLEERGGIPVVGVVPFMQLDLDDEDSLAPQLTQTNRPPAGKPVEIAVVRLPRLSNFTDFNVFSRIPEVDLRYVSRPEALGEPDMVILPGTKNTMADLRWLRQSGMAEAVSGLRQEGCVIFGVCGGYQMLGRSILDPDHTEEGGRAQGLGFLDSETVFAGQKRRTRVSGRIGALPGILGPLGGMEIEGYEIHMGRTQGAEGCLCRIRDRKSGEASPDGAAAGNVYGTYVHGFFDAPGVARAAAEALAAGKGTALGRKGGGPMACGQAAGSRAALQKGSSDPGGREYKETQYDLLAQTLRAHLDLQRIYEIMGVPAQGNS
ncbi:MAG: cobyric acid synthase [Eubacteriales bacterium]|nr:cobyric acid synthase [Eubacteriales bacterium]